MLMRVHLYVPAKLYGFCEDDVGRRVFFHASVFHPTSVGEPPPVLGEPVDVTANDGDRAELVRRISSPTPGAGIVKTFDASSGWGFIRGDDQVDYFLHRSDIVLNKMPVRGQRVSFHRGHKNGRPRACYVEV